MRITSISIAAALSLGLAAPATADPLELSFLPPDFPPTDICRAPAEVFEANETQVTGEEEDNDDPDLWLTYLNRDIRDLTARDANVHFDFINDLITMKAGLDPKFAGTDEAFARIDLYLDAGRMDDLQNAGLVEALLAQADDLGQGDRVTLARYVMAGIGIAADPGRGEAMITEEAYAGNANALMELLHLQLAGAELADWFEPPERTATLALGGRLGQLNRGLCGRAESIARAYEDGEILVPNPDLAFAWRKFAADQGGQAAAWRVVEHMLNTARSGFADDRLLHYLRLATDTAFRLESSDIDALRRAGATQQTEIVQTLTRLHNQVPGQFETSAVPHFNLMPHETEDEIDGDSPHLNYLHQITGFENVPGVIWRRLADEIVLRKGRWTGEAEAMAALERAVDAGDAEATVKLAQMNLRRGVREGDTSPTEALLLDAVDLHGHAAAMDALDGYYRCTAAPSGLSLSLANHWSAAWTGSADATIAMPTQPFLTLTSNEAPEVLATFQRHAMAGRSTELATFLQRLEADPVTTAEAIRHWGRQVSRNDKALELYALAQFELSDTSGHAESAVDIARRAYAAIGPAMALDLAVTLVDHQGRDPGIAAEVRALLEDASSRGEGASIRLLHRLTGGRGDAVFRRYADVIDARGDFLALMFAAPYLDDATFDDYMARAVAEMRCGTKDVSELADAYADRNRPAEALHWLKVGLTIEGGHSMSRLGLALHDLTTFDTRQQVRVAPEQRSVLNGFKADYARLSRPDTAGFDRDAAAQVLAKGLTHTDREVFAWALDEYAVAETGIRRALDGILDVGARLQNADATRVPAAIHALGLHLRDTARNGDDLAASTDALMRAAKAGHTGAMVDYAEALTHGIGVHRDRPLALIWLRKADALAEPRAGAAARLVQALLEAE